MNTDTMGTFAQQVEDRLVRLHDRYVSGEVGRGDFVNLASVILGQAWVRGYSLADLGVAADLTAIRGVAVPTIGLAPGDRMWFDVAAATQETLDSEQYKANAAAAIAVLGRAQALEAIQLATGQALDGHEVAGWTRVLNAGACELCEDLAGDVLPASADMYHHKGCGCSQRPVEEQS